MVWGRHLFRYLHFGIQLAESGRIQDYMVANPYWEEMRPMTSLVWEDYERRFRPTYIHVRTYFHAERAGMLALLTAHQHCSADGSISQGSCQTNGSGKLGPQSSPFLWLMGC